MARVKITCTCIRCGKEFEHIKRGLYNSRAASDYEEWAKANVNVCSECHEQNEKKKTDPFKAEFFMEIRERKVVCGLKITSNNAYARKDDLKAYGFKFNDKWELTFIADNYDQMIEKIQDMVEKFMEEFPGSESYSWITEKDAREMFENAAKIETELNKLGPKPKYPEEFLNMWGDKRWNGKIYGSKIKSVYLDNERYNISDELAEEIKNVQEAREKWVSTKKKIMEG